MMIREMMTKNVSVLPMDATVNEAALKMKEMGVGSIPVVDQKHIVGMVTDRDIAVRAAAEGLDPKSTKVSNILTQDVVACYEDQDAKDAAMLMQSKQVRRLPVLNRQEMLVGIVSLGDIAFKEDDERLGGGVLREISRPQ